MHPHADTARPRRRLPAPGQVLAITGMIATLVLRVATGDDGGGTSSAR